MTDVKFVGDQDGIELWNLMTSSDDAQEQQYVQTINTAAMKHGKVWFTDIVTQREKPLNNQAVWMLNWDAQDSQWSISLFHLPEGAQKRSKRLDPEPIEISLDDIVIS